MEELEVPALSRVDLLGLRALRGDEAAALLGFQTLALSAVDDVEGIPRNPMPSFPLLVPYLEGLPPPLLPLVILVQPDILHLALFDQILALNSTDLLEILSAVWLEEDRALLCGIRDLLDNKRKRH